MIKKVNLLTTNNASLVNVNLKYAFSIQEIL